MALVDRIRQEEPRDNKTYASGFHDGAITPIGGWVKFWPYHYGAFGHRFVHLTPI